MTDVTKVIGSEDILGYGQMIAIATAQAHEDRLETATTEAEYLILHLDETGQKLTLIARERLGFAPSEGFPAFSADKAAAYMAGTAEQVIRSMVQKVYIDKNFIPTKRLRVEAMKDGLEEFSIFKYGILDEENRRVVSDTLLRVKNVTQSTKLRDFMDRLVKAPALRTVSAS